MDLLILQLLKELIDQQKHLKREDVRKASKSNHKLLRLIRLLEIEKNKNEKKKKERV